MSSNTNSTNVPGLKFPTQKAMLAGNPRDSAIQSNTNMNQKTASLSAAVGGAKMRKRTRGKRIGGAVAVPQFQMQYSDQSGPGGSPNNQVQQNSQISTQQVANASYDSEALNKKGGYKKIRKHSSRKLNTRKLNTRKLRKQRTGGTMKSDWKWGCYSGGKDRGGKHSGGKNRGGNKTQKSKTSNNKFINNVFDGTFITSLFA